MRSRQSKTQPQKSQQGNTLFASDCPTDAEGFLIDLTQWNSKIALAIAEQEQLILEEPHWEIIHLLRQFYQRYDHSPANKALVNYVKKELGANKGNSTYLMLLFKSPSKATPAKLASKIAGLPKPDNCL